MKSHSRAEAYAPATVANLGVGFDILGLAVEGLGDTVLVEWNDSSESVIVDIEGDGGRLPREADKNVVGVVANSVLKTVGEACGVKIHLKKGLPLGSGLGSSAASSAASAVAVNALLGEPLSREALLPACLEGEALVSGYHADNVGPSLLGGITLITGTDIDDIRRLPIPDNLYLALVTPKVEVPTSEARAVLPDMVSLKTMVAQTGSVGRVMDALYRGDIPQLGQAMEADFVIEPARQHLMPMLAEVRQVAKQHGAYGMVISGAGPTLCAICDDIVVSQNVADVMQGVYQEAGLQSQAYSTQVLTEGARVISVG